MGNSNEKGVRQALHPDLRQGYINNKQNTIQIMIKPGLGFSNWRWNLSPLQPFKKYLFLPMKFIDPQLSNVESTSCCAPENIMQKDQYVIAQYQPYLFTLENQILLRKARNKIFKQYQLWKILKVGVLAIQDWGQVYQDVTIGNNLSPRSFLFNQEGHIKVVNQFSFLQSCNQVKSNAYIPPLDKLDSNKNGQQSAESLSIFSLGVVLLDSITLSQSQYSGMATVEKKQYLQKSLIYPEQIKKTILGMVDPRKAQRIKLGEIKDRIRSYKRLSKQVQQI